jgi:hypothetical protein
METDGTNKDEPTGTWISPSLTISSCLLLFILCLFEYSFIKYVWLKPMQATHMITIIFIQIIVLLPVLAGLNARSEMAKKLKAVEISSAYSSELSFWFLNQLICVYLAFLFLVELIPH